MTKKIKWLTLQQAADHMACEVSTIRRMIKRGDLAAYRSGSRIVRVRESDLDAMLTPVANSQDQDTSRKAVYVDPRPVRDSGSVKVADLPPADEYGVRSIL